VAPLPDVNGDAVTIGHKGMSKGLAWRGQQRRRGRCIGSLGTWRIGWGFEPQGCYFNPPMLMPADGLVRVIRSKRKPLQGVSGP